ncbi:unnamed protein product [Mytilus edulis]|uniref:SUEL-type lectin domain-containing protein n=1 Tax=Mytilus edulis TaxID=6550 RepID=A0A8S3PW95_MYTED|nr:unnamed protein product [Mytilus edulis]
MVQVCEDTSSEISCEGSDFTHISIINATYGRNEETTCPHSSVYGSFLFPCTMNVKEKIELLCQDHTTCIVTPSNTEYGGEPCLDIYKYLTVYFKCSAGYILPITGFQMLELCEGEESIVSCQGLYSPKIMITNATFGRYDGFTCPHSSVSSFASPCIMDSTEKVKQLCQDQMTCSITPSNSAYGNDPCPGIFKYLTIYYRCSVEDFFVNQYYEEEEHEILQKVILTTDAMSFIDCARTCTSIIDCYGFEYKQDDLTCHIVSSVTIGSVSVVVEAMGCLSISIRYPRYRQLRQRFQAGVQVMECLSISTTKTEVSGRCSSYKMFVGIVDIDNKDRDFRLLFKLWDAYRYR